MYVTLKLDDSGCRFHSVSDGNEEIVTNKRYVIIPWKMVTRYGTNVTLKEAVEEMKEEGEERRLVSKFEAEHKDEISEILGVIAYIDKGYVKERFLRFTNLGSSNWVYTSKINLFLKRIAPVTRLTEVITNLIISKRPLKHIKADIRMLLNPLRKLRN